MKVRTAQPGTPPTVIPAKAGIHVTFEPILPMNSLHDHGCSEGAGYMFG